MPCLSIFNFAYSTPDFLTLYLDILAFTQEGNLYFFWRFKGGGLFLTVDEDGDAHYGNKLSNNITRG